MKLLCVGDRGSDLSREVLEKSGNTPESRFNLTKNRQYRAHAMALWTYGLGVLIVDDTGNPNWKLIELFDVIDGRLDPRWVFTPGRDRDPLVLGLWGYPALINDPDHYVALIERKRSAYDAFMNESGSE